MEYVHIGGVIVAALASLGLGFLWYSKYLFGTLWMNLSGITSESLSQGGLKQTIRTTLFSLLFEGIRAYGFAYLLGVMAMTSLGQAFHFAFWAWLAFMTPILIGEVLWQNKSPLLFILNATYQLTASILVVVILTLFS